MEHFTRLATIIIINNMVMQQKSKTFVYNTIKWQLGLQIKSYGLQFPMVFTCEMQPLRFTWQPLKNQITSPSSSVHILRHKNSTSFSSSFTFLLIHFFCCFLRLLSFYDFHFNGKMNAMLWTKCSDQMQNERNNRNGLIFARKNFCFPSSVCVYFSPKWKTSACLFPPHCTRCHRFTFAIWNCVVSVHSFAHNNINTIIN